MYDMRVSQLHMFHSVPIYDSLYSVPTCYTEIPPINPYKQDINPF